MPAKLLMTLGAMRERLGIGELDAIVARAAAASGTSWDLARTTDGEPSITVRFSDGRRESLRLTRDQQPASAADVEFVAHSRADVGRLSATLSGRDVLSEIELRAIEKRARQASPSPWRPFLETDGGTGGSSVIWVTDSDDEPDLYLWLGDSLAPPEDFEFVAAARADIPRLLAAVKRLGS